MSAARARGLLGGKPEQSLRQTSCNMIAGLRLPVVRFAEPLESTESHLNASDIGRG
jgi:hypothetical protein